MGLSPVTNRFLLDLPQSMYGGVIQRPVDRVKPTVAKGPVICPFAMMFDSVRVNLERK